MSKYLDTALSAVPSTAALTNVLGLSVSDSSWQYVSSPNRSELLCVLSQGWVGNREGVGDSQGLPWMLLSLLNLFCKMMCVHRHVQWFQR